MADTELVINLRNHQRAEREFDRPAVVADPEQDAREQKRQEAMGRLLARSLGDEVVADLLTVLGLVP